MHCCTVVHHARTGALSVAPKLPLGRLSFAADVGVDADGAATGPAPFNTTQ